MNFEKELAEIEKVSDLMEIAEEKVAKRFELEIRKMLAKYKKYNLAFHSGNGTWHFSRDGKGLYDWRDENKLPKDILELYDFLMSHDYILKYISNIKLGDHDELKEQQAS